MGIYLCLDRNEANQISSCSPFSASPLSQEEVRGSKLLSVESETDVSVEAKDVFKTSPVDIIRTNGELTCRRTMSYPVGTQGGLRSQVRNIANSHTPRLCIKYSSPQDLHEQTVLVDESLVKALEAPDDQLLHPPIQRFSTNRRSLSNSIPKKKVRFNETVTIHRISYQSVGISKAKPAMYKLVILLREVWIKLDVDEDSHLNISELKRFCHDVWEEPFDDAGATKIMSLYAKVDPSKGMNFNEWCLLIKDEDPDLNEFVEELYEIFVDPSMSQTNTTSVSAT